MGQGHWNRRQQLPVVKAAWGTAWRKSRHARGRGQLKHQFFHSRDPHERKKGHKCRCKISTGPGVKLSSRVVLKKGRRNALDTFEMALRASKYIHRTERSNSCRARCDSMKDRIRLSEVLWPRQKSSQVKDWRTTNNIRRDRTDQAMKIGLST